VESQEEIMKKNLILYMVVLTLLAVLAIPAQLAAQDKPDHKHLHHHYKLIDMGTFGGPKSYINGFEYMGVVQNLNNAGTLTGWADRSKVDPYCMSGNSYGNFCFNYDQPPSCFGEIGCPGHVSHAFQSQGGVRTDLGALPGGLSSATAWISANGLIAGASQNGETDPLDPGFPEDRAVLWRDGNIIDLGTLSEGGYESGAQAVNSRGQVVGWAFNTIPDPYYFVGFSSILYNFYQPIYPYQERAFFWQDGVMQDLGTLGTGNDALAMAINEPGQVIGISYTNPTANQITTPCSIGPSPTLDPFLWDKQSGMIDLGTLGGTCGIPFWINNSGQVVGVSDLAGDQVQHSFLWSTANGMQDLGTLGGSDAEASMINDLGVVVGGSQLEGDAQYDAFLWDGQMHDLGTVDGANCAYAYSINNHMQVVGNSGYNCGTKAFLWEDGGPMVNLSPLVSNTTSLTALGVININDGGEIAGIGHFVDFGDNGHAVLLIPCDENHPNLEGCDYSLVDAADSPQAASLSGTGVKCQTEGEPCGYRGHVCCEKLECVAEGNRNRCEPINGSKASSFWGRLKANTLR
jgi:probable HAF family extracellular repeat protein